MNADLGKAVPFTRAERGAVDLAAMRMSCADRRVRADMAAILKAGAEQRGWPDISDLTRSGYRDDVAAELGVAVLAETAAGGRRHAARRPVKEAAARPPGGGSR